MSFLKRTVLAAAVAVAVSGCATVTRMPLQEKADAPDLKQKSVMVARLKIRNENKPGHQPNLLCILAKDAKNPEAETFSFTQPTLLADKEEAGKDYFVSMEMAPGQTKILLARFLRQIPLLMNAIAEADLNYEVEVPPNSILYLGSVEAVILPRTDDAQPHAGGPLPLIDQAVAGFSNGTFRVEVKDDFEKDQQELLVRYPFLKGKEILKRVLPAKPPVPAPRPTPPAAPDPTGPIS